MTGVLFAAGAAAAGAVQARLVADEARRASFVGSFIVRYALTAAALVLAARAGYIFWGAAGWGLGFAVAAVVAYRRIR